MLMLIISIVPLQKPTKKQKIELENVVNSNYYNIDQFQTITFHEKISGYPYFI